MRGLSFWLPSTPITYLSLATDRYAVSSKQKLNPDSDIFQRAKEDVDNLIIPPKVTPKTSPPWPPAPQISAALWQVPAAILHPLMLRE